MLPESAPLNFSEAFENSELISPERLSAKISKLEEPGRLTSIPAEELVMSMSSFGGEENRMVAFPLRLSIFTLPPAFSMLTS